MNKTIDNIIENILNYNTSEKKYLIPKFTTDAILRYYDPKNRPNKLHQAVKLRDKEIANFNNNIEYFYDNFLTMETFLKYETLLLFELQYLRDEKNRLLEPNRITEILQQRRNDVIKEIGNLITLTKVMEHNIGLQKINNVDKQKAIRNTLTENNLLLKILSFKSATIPDTGNQTNVVEYNNQMDSLGREIVAGIRYKIFVNADHVGLPMYVLTLNKNHAANLSIRDLSHFLKKDVIKQLTSGDNKIDNLIEIKQQLDSNLVTVEVKEIVYGDHKNQVILNHEDEQNVFNFMLNTIEGSDPDEVRKKFLQKTRFFRIFVDKAPRETTDKNISNIDVPRETKHEKTRTNRWFPSFGRGGYRKSKKKRVTKKRIRKRTHTQNNPKH